MHALPIGIYMANTKGLGLRNYFTVFQSFFGRKQNFFLSFQNARHIFSTNILFKLLHMAALLVKVLHIEANNQKKKKKKKICENNAVQQHYHYDDHKYLSFSRIKAVQIVIITSNIIIRLGLELVCLD